MKAIIVPVGAMPEVVEIDGSLASMQDVIVSNIRQAACRNRP